MTAEREVTLDTGVVRTMRRLHFPHKLRNRELWLLIFSWIISGGALVLVSLGATGELSSEPVIAGLIISAATLVLHIVLRFRAAQADPLLLPIVTALNGLGIAEIYRIDLARNLTGWDAASTRQVMWTIIAIACAIAVILFVRNHRVFYRFTYVFGFFAFALLLLPLLPGIGTTINGARVWINLFGVMSFQPGEVAKIALAIFFAGYLVRTRETLSAVGPVFLGIRFPRLRDLGPLIVVWLLAMAIIVFQRDMGTALLYFGMFLTMLYMATGRPSWIIIGVGLFLGGALVASQSLSYVHGRFQAWLDPFSPEVYEAGGGSYQLVQGLFGLAHGGLIGTGLGQGRPDLTPVAESDYIIAALGEELGLVGLFAILALYLILVARGLRIGFRAQDDFAKLLAVGLAITIALQVFIMVGGVTRVIPVTGLTTPFLAAGGSSLVANWMIAAILLRLGDGVRDRPVAIREGES